MNKSINLIENRIKELDFLRSVAIIFVLIIHSSTRYAITEQEKLIGVWFSTFTRPCIAIFLFLSGYLLAGRYFDFSSLKNRLKRVLVPYLFFSIFAFVYTYKYTLLTLSLKGYLKLMVDLFAGGSFGIYYFVFIICCTYMLFFLTQKTNFSTNTLLLFFGAIAFIHTAYYDAIVNLLGLEQRPFFEYYNYRYIFWPFFFYFGVFFKEKNGLDVCRLNQTALVGLWAFVFVLYNIFYFSGVNSIDGYNSVIGNLYSLATIMVLSSFQITSLLSTYVSNMSYYLYLSHIFIVYIVRDIASLYAPPPPFWFSIISFFLSLLIPLLVYKFLQKVFGNKLSYLFGIRIS